MTKVSEPTYVYETKKGFANEIKAILAVQVDTASGAYNDIEAIGKAIKAAGHPALFMVDAERVVAVDPIEGRHVAGEIPS